MWSPFLADPVFETQQLFGLPLDECGDLGFVTVFKTLTQSACRTRYYLPIILVHKGKR